jgi:hypothetical protein
MKAIVAEAVKEAKAEAKAEVQAAATGASPAEVAAAGEAAKKAVQKEASPAVVAAEKAAVSSSGSGPAVSAGEEARRAAAEKETQSSLACGVCRMLVGHIFNFEAHNPKQLCSIGPDASADLCATFLQGQGPDFYSELKLLVDRAPDPCAKIGLCPAKPQDLEMDLLVEEPEASVAETVPDMLYSEIPARLEAAEQLTDPDGLTGDDDQTQ